LGIGDVPKTNTFRQLLPFPEAVTHIAVADESAYFLLESGHLFSCDSDRAIQIKRLAFSGGSVPWRGTASGRSQSAVERIARLTVT
jgi:hypothetical protein